MPKNQRLCFTIDGLTFYTRYSEVVNCSYKVWAIAHLLIVNQPCVGVATTIDGSNCQVDKVKG